MIFMTSVTHRRLCVNIFYALIIISIANIIYLSRQKWKKIKHVTFFTFLILIFTRLYLDVTSLQCKYKSKHTHWFLKKAGEGNMQMESEEKKCKQINGLNMQWAVKRQRASPDCSGSAAIYKYHPRHYTSPLCTFRILTVGVMLVRGRHKNHFNCSVTELRPTAPTCQQTSKKERRKKWSSHLTVLWLCRCPHSTASHYSLVITNRGSPLTVHRSTCDKPDPGRLPDLETQVLTSIGHFWGF